MTNRELLEFAAKAAGISLRWQEGWNGMPDWAFHGEIIWNPLEDDGDALRLAVKLGIFVAPKAYQLGADIATPRLVAAARFSVNQSMPPDSSIEVDHKDWGFDAGTATCRAIVVAAAEIGKGM